MSFAVVRQDAETARHDSMADEWLRRVARRAPHITAAEERRAIAAIHARDDSAARLLCEAHEGFLRTCARPWSKLCDVDDLLQEARAELLRAAVDFDLNYEVRLLTFAAPRIRVRLRRYARANAASVATPKGADIARDVEWDERTFRRVADAPNEGELCQAIDVRAEIRRTRKRRAEVLSLRLQGLSHEEIAAELGISRQRCQQLEADGWWPVSAGDLRDTSTLAVGDRYGCLVVQAPAGNAAHNGESMFSCLCECGRVKVMRKAHIVRSRACRCARAPLARANGRFGGSDAAAR